MRPIKIKNYKHYKEVKSSLIMPDAPYKLLSIDELGNLAIAESYLVPDEALRVAEFILKFYGDSHD